MGNTLVRHRCLVSIVFSQSTALALRHHLSASTASAAGVTAERFCTFRACLERPHWWNTAHQRRSPVSLPCVRRAHPNRSPSPCAAIRAPDRQRSWSGGGKVLRGPSFTDETGMGVYRLETTKSAIKTPGMRQSQIWPPAATSRNLLLLNCKMCTKVNAVQDLAVPRGFGTVRSVPDGQVRLKYVVSARSCLAVTV